MIVMMFSQPESERRLFMPDSKTQPEPTLEQPRGWLIECPACGAHWKISRDDILIGDGRWQQCPSCQDTATGPCEPIQRRDKPPKRRDGER